MPSLITFTPFTPIIGWLVLNINAGLAFSLPLQCRPWTLPAILVPAYITFNTINYLSVPPGLSGVWGYVTLLGLFHFTSLLYIKRWTLRREKGDNGKRLRDSAPFNTRSWQRIYRITTNPRLLNTTHQDVNGMEENPSLAFSSRKAPFSYWSVIRVLIGWLIQLFIVTPIFPGAFMNMAFTGFGPSRTVFFRRLCLMVLHRSVEMVTTEEALLRVVYALNSFWMPVLILETVNTMFAIFWVFIVRVGKPQDWPHLFGNPLEAYTLGRFWSRSATPPFSDREFLANISHRFWHRGHVPSYMDFSQLLINILPHALRKNQHVTTTFTHFLFFLFSGLVHTLVSWQTHGACAFYGDIKFFLTNFAAVTIEGVVLDRFNKTDGRKTSTQQEQKRKYEDKKGQNSVDRDNGVSRSGQRQVSLLWRCIGYIWVFGFFFWAIPKFYYPEMECTVKAVIMMQVQKFFRWEGS